jgi:hypothetical protein
MNWKRVVSYAGLLILATAGAAFPFGVVEGYMAARGSSVPAGWFYLVQGLAVLAAAVAVFRALAIREPSRPYEHAISTLGASLLVTTPVDILLLGQPFVFWLVGLLGSMLATVIGVAIGRRTSGPVHEATSPPETGGDTTRCSVCRRPY